MGPRAGEHEGRMGPRAGGFFASLDLGNVGLQAQGMITDGEGAGEATLVLMHEVKRLGVVRRLDAIERPAKRVVRSLCSEPSVLSGQ